MKSILLATIAALSTSTAHAGPKLIGSLQSKQYDSIPSYTQMTPSGLEHYQMFRSAVASKALTKKHDERLMIAVIPTDKHRANLIHQLETKPDGSVVHSAFEAPQIHLTPKETSAVIRYIDIEPGAGVRHTFETNAGTLDWVQTYRVERWYDFRALRIQAHEAKHTDAASTYASLDKMGDGLSITVHNKKENVRGKLVLPPHDDSIGMTVGFTVDSNGRKFRWYAINDKKEIVESTYELQMTDQIRADQNMQLKHELRGRQILSKAEVDRLGFFKAELKVFAGRKAAPEADAGIRGMKVRSAPDSVPVATGGQQ